MIVTKAWRLLPWSRRRLFVLSCRLVSWIVVGPPTAPVFRGCPCRDARESSHIQGDVTTKRQPFCVLFGVLLQCDSRVRGRDRGREKRVCVRLRILTDIVIQIISVSVSMSMSVSVSVRVSVSVSVFVSLLLLFFSFLDVFHLFDHLFYL